MKQLTIKDCCMWSSATIEGKLGLRLLIFEMGFNGSYLGVDNIKSLLSIFGVLNL